MQIIIKTNIIVHALQKRCRKPLILPDIAANGDAADCPSAGLPHHPFAVFECSGWDGECKEIKGGQLMEELCYEEC